MLWHFCQLEFLAPFDLKALEFCLARLEGSLTLQHVSGFHLDVKARIEAIGF